MPTSTSESPKSLLGYLGCPVNGERYNSKTHPWFGEARRTVDLLQFRCASDHDADEAIAHFQRLGYLVHIQDNCGNPGAVVFLPQINPCSGYDSGNGLSAQFLAESLELIAKHRHPHAERACMALLAGDSVDDISRSRLLEAVRGFLRAASQRPNARDLLHTAAAAHAAQQGLVTHGSEVALLISGEF